MLAARTDIEAVNQSLALSIRATSSLVNVAERLHARRLELNTRKWSNCPDSVKSHTTIVF